MEAKIIQVIYVKDEDGQHFFTLDGQNICTVKEEEHAETMNNNADNA